MEAISKRVKDILSRNEKRMATIVSPPYFSPVEDAENIKKACQGSTFL